MRMSRRRIAMSVAWLLAPGWSRPRRASRAPGRRSSRSRLAIPGWQHSARLWPPRVHAGSRRGRRPGSAVHSMTHRLPVRPDKPLRAPRPLCTLGDGCRGTAGEHLGVDVGGTDQRVFLRQRGFQLAWFFGAFGHPGGICRHGSKTLLVSADRLAIDAGDALDLPLALPGAQQGPNGRLPMRLQDIDSVTLLAEGAESNVLPGSGCRQVPAPPTPSRLDGRGGGTYASTSGGI